MEYNGFNNAIYHVLLWEKFAVIAIFKPPKLDLKNQK